MCNVSRNHYSPHHPHETECKNEADLSCLKRLTEANREMTLDTMTEHQDPPMMVHKQGRNVGEVATAMTLVVAEIVVVEIVVATAPSVTIMTDDTMIAEAVVAGTTTTETMIVVEIVVGEIVVVEIVVAVPTAMMSHQDQASTTKIRHLAKLTQSEDYQH